MAVVTATFLKCRNFKKNNGRGKFVAVSGRKVAVKRLNVAAKIV
jgi:hypothetical protein